MLHPSYQELIEKMNETASEDNAAIQSRYSLVIASSKRARQLNAGSQELVAVRNKNSKLSTAVDELYAGKVHVLKEEEASEEIVNE